MIRQFILASILSLTATYLQANSDTYQFKYLPQSMEREWNGKDQRLSIQNSFCIQLDSGHTQTPVPSMLDITNIRYQLKVDNLNGGGNKFIAVNGENTIPIELLLTSPQGISQLAPGQDTSEMNDSVFCEKPGQNLILTANVQNLNEQPAGEYKASLRMSAFNNKFQTLTTKDIDIIIIIPKFISISAPSEIPIEDVKNPQVTAPLCIYRNGYGLYNFKAESLGGSKANSFELTREGQIKSTIEYQVSIQENSGRKHSVSPKQPIQGLHGSNSHDCLDGKKLNLQIAIPKPNINRAYAGTYQGQLKITVEVQ
ncbi:hypothetical protein ACH42_08365 [Endozoicomonas sp. (ex Bugula neritina AB1)]|nr:hypothetical protein ACH42_08365 [Endozoicomonas sp. (ex Bugula neritina AB1)]